jgi:hypothetical protein
MVADEIRKFREAEPFRPYKLVLASGEELVIDHRAGIGIAPQEKYFVYALEPDGYRVLRPSEVTSVKPVEGTAA